MKKAEAFIEACKNIKMLLFDCDGVLTDGRIVLGNDGIELKNDDVIIVCQSNKTANLVHMGLKSFYDSTFDKLLYKN